MICYSVQDSIPIQNVRVIVTLMAIFSANDTVYQSQLKDIGSSPVNEKNTYGANRIDVSYFKANRQVKTSKYARCATIDNSSIFLYIKIFFMHCMIMYNYSRLKIAKNHIIPKKKYEPI